MNKPFVSVTLISALLTFSAIGAEQTSPSFSKDVAPIVYKHCATCHRHGDIAPMPLLTYEQVRPWAKSIREKVSLGQMPPWHATQPRGTFLNDRRLTDVEKDTLVRWAKDGAPQGDQKDMPPAPTFTEGWDIGTPDVILSMAKSYDVPPSGTINYQYFTVPTNFSEDKWVQAIEVRPGTRSVVHHVLVFLREPGAQPRQNAFVQVTPPIKAEALRPHDPNESQAGDRSKSMTLAATTAPGTNAMTFRPGTAIRIKAGTVLVFQIHYTANGKVATDTTSVGMIFAKEPPRQEIRNSAFINPSFVLPAGDSNKAVDSAIEFTEDSHIWALFPHTHLRGKSWEYHVVYPGGRTETVLAVPKYDFNWQTYYLFATPLAVPKGARLEATAHYDNSAANAWNPDPKVDVRWGEQTWQEMQYTGITYSVDAAPSPAATARNERQ